MSVPIGPLHPQEAPKEAKVTPLFSKDLADFPGKEGLRFVNIAAHNQIFLGELARELWAREMQRFRASALM
jgi:hypothetical protein